MADVTTTKPRTRGVAEENHRDVTYPDGGPMAIGQNVTWQVKDNVLYLVCNLDQDFGETASGKSRKIASTNGTFDIPGTNVRIGLNVFYKASK